MPIDHVRGVAPLLLLDPSRSTYEAMLAGWTRNQTSRALSRNTIASNVWIVRRFAAFTGSMPWEWVAVDIEDYTSALLSQTPPLQHSTIRGYHQSIKTFCNFLTNPGYDWLQVCDERFGKVPIQICHPWNTHLHLNEFEASPGRRPFSYDELEAFFAHADDAVERIIQLGRKGALSALRDAQFFKTVYAFGLRRSEARNLDLTDLHANPSMPSWGAYGQLHVRFGKSDKGGPPKRRMVLAVPEFDWALDGLRMWIEEARPRFRASDCQAIWVTERRARVSNRHVNSRFALYRAELGLSPSLTLHSLRHSYVTHLIELGYAERFVQEQVGHAYASTTAIYTSVSDDYKNRILEAAIARVYGKDGES